MKNGIIVLVLFSLFTGSSCVTLNRCHKKFPPQSDTLVTVITRDTIIYRDSLIPYYLPGEIRIDSVIIPCPPTEVGYRPDTVTVENPYAEAKAWWTYPYLRLMLVQKDTTILLKVALKEAHHWKSAYEKVTTIPQPVKYIPQIYKICLWICIGIFGVGLLYIVFRVFKLFSIP